MRNTITLFTIALVAAFTIQHLRMASPTVPQVAASAGIAAPAQPVASSAASGPTPAPAARAHASAAAPTATLQVLGDEGAAFSAGSCHINGALPDAKCSPGAITTATKANVCTRGWAGQHRHVTESQKRAVYAEYGITIHSGATYEMDHIVSLELGGSNNVQNLYPESAPSFHDKDRVENAAHRAVCDGSLDLAVAQQAIASDWTKLNYLVK